MAHTENVTPDSGLCTSIKVVRNEDLYQQIGRDIHFDLVDPNKVQSFRVLSTKLFIHFKEMVAVRFGVPMQLQRFWMWAKRLNHTYRPCRPLTCAEEKLPIGQLERRKTEAGDWELILLLENFDLGPDLCTLRLRNKTIEDMLLFFKLYDPEIETIRYVGNLFVKGCSMPGDILKMLNDMANFAPDEEIILYEEIKFVPIVMCELVDKEHTFASNQLENGDIICFQKAHPVQMNCRYPDIPSFLGYIRRYQGLPEAKLKVISVKRKMEEVDQHMRPLQLGVMLRKYDLKITEEKMAPLQLKVIAIQKELKEAEENMAPLQLVAVAIDNEVKEMEDKLASLQSKMVMLKEELKEAEDNVGALDPSTNWLL